MINKVWDYVQKYEMLQKEDYVVTGVSGGADSVCLLLMLKKLQKKVSFFIHVVHINHKIRIDAAADAKYVEDLCKELDIPFTLVEKNVEELAKAEHISTEEAGRKVRYEAFERVLAEHASDRRGKIAIAHNQSDCAETFLWNVFRGSGVKGLVGISPVRGQIIRPIMCLTRDEIETFLSQENRDFCIDCTNLENNYTRNKIRNQILPFVEKEVCRQAVFHIAETCSKMQEVNGLIQDLTTQAFQQCVKKDEMGSHLQLTAWNRIHPTIRSYVVLELLASVAGSRKNLETKHVEQVMDLFDKQCGREIDLPYGMKAIREYEGICITAKAKQNEKKYVALTREDYAELEEGKTVCIRLSEDNQIFLRLFMVKERLEEKNIPVKPYTKWIDYDTIKDNIVIRNRLSGDYMTINAQCQHKTLKSILIDDKIPKKQRDLLLLLADGNHVLWVIGGRMSSICKVQTDTQRILEVIYEGGVPNG